jgi:poly-gamma-glutamate synthesis protein (capsule biosynthesis protein)
MSELTVNLTGDVMLGRAVDLVLRDLPAGYVWGDMIDDLRRADFTLVNLECALTRSDEAAFDGTVKPFYFRSDPSHVSALLAAGVDCACIANNHARDFGTQGLLDTIEALDSAGIAHAGAGADTRAASSPALLRRDGWTLAVVACADYPQEWAAGSDTPGINFMPVSMDSASLGRIREMLEAARCAADFVIFSIHWGPNMRERPPGGFKQFAHAVLDAGADLYWGHSAHILQGIEVYKGKPLLYDTGDFVDDYAVDPSLRNDLSALFRVIVNGPRVDRVELLPVAIRNMQVNHAAGPDREWVEQRVAQLSAESGTHVEVFQDLIRVPMAVA